MINDNLSKNKGLTPLEELIQQAGRLKSVRTTLVVAYEVTAQALDEEGMPEGTRRMLSSLKSAQSNLVNSITEMQAIIADILLAEREAIIDASEADEEKAQFP